ncbi:uncharacterized protein LOC111251027 [Varroa destructor]|uniref:Uncharacterized protein n=1 Tax=Varroa destructor TaxID=109461 RepID=A0A7M7K932_VARDE|nr:uncharacterized protein LOC111251027 [Varroa destructor]
MEEKNKLESKRISGPNPLKTSDVKSIFQSSDAAGSDATSDIRSRRESKNTPMSPGPPRAPQLSSDSTSPQQENSQEKAGLNTYILSPEPKSGFKVAVDKVVARAPADGNVAKTLESKIFGKKPNAKHSDNDWKTSKRLISPPSDSQTMSSLSTTTTSGSSFTPAGQKRSPASDRQDDLQNIFGEHVDPQSVSATSKPKGVSKATILVIVVVIIAVGIIAYFVIKGKKLDESQAIELGKASFKEFSCPKTITAVDALAMKVSTDLSNAETSSGLRVEWIVVFRIPVNVTENQNIHSSFVSMVFSSTRFKSMLLFTMDRCSRSSQRIFLFPEASDDITIDRLNLQTWFDQRAQLLQDYNCSIEFRVSDTGRTDLVATVVVAAELDLSKPLLQVSTCLHQTCRVIYETTALDLLNEGLDLSKVDLLLHEGWVGQAPIGRDYKMMNYVTVETKCVGTS